MQDLCADRIGRSLDPCRAVCRWTCGPDFFCSSLPGGCGRHSVLYGRGQFCRVRVGLVAGRSCPVLFYCVHSSLFQSIPVYSGPFYSGPFYSGPFYSRPACPARPARPVPSSPVQSGPVRSSPVQSQFSLAQPGPAQLGPVRPVLVCGSGVVVPVGRALCGLTDGEGPRDLTGRALCGLTFCRENGLSGRGPVGQLCGRVGALAVAVLAGILSLKVRKRRGTLRVPPFDCIGIFFRSVQKALIDKHLSDPCPVYDRPAASVDEAQRNAEAAVVDVEIGIDLR